MTKQNYSEWYKRELKRRRTHALQLLTSAAIITGIIIIPILTT